MAALLNGVYLDCEREFSNILNGGFLEADLDGTTFAYDCRMRFLECALLASCKKSHTTLVIQLCLYLPLS